VKARRVKGVDPEASLRANAALIVRTRLDELNSLAEPALEPGAITAQHDLRIAAKRLRYVLEITETCFGEEAEVARNAAKELQGVLGEMHDHDTMLSRVQGIESLEEQLRIGREQLFRRFHGLWQIEASRGTWVALERALH
jgi:CHAD domain-containing protein